LIEKATQNIYITQQILANDLSRPWTMPYWACLPLYAHCEQKCTLTSREGYIDSTDALVEQQTRENLITQD